MKIESSMEQFLPAVSLAARFIQKQSSLPVLSCILIIAEGDSVVLRATNLECGIEIEVPAKVIQSGTAAVLGGTLLGFLMNSRGKTVGIESSTTPPGNTPTGETFSGTVRFTTERAHASIKTLPHEDFPVLPRVSAEKMFSLKSSDFVRSLRSVIHCASVSNIKPELQSVLLFGDAGKLFTAATDSFRLAEKQSSLKSRGGIPNLLLPARNAAELMRILETAKGDVDVYYNENQLSAQIGNIYYTSRLLDGAFPNYKQIVPTNSSTEAVVLREDLAQALKGLSVFSDKFLQVTFEVDVKEKIVKLSSRNADIGEQESILKAAVSGENVKISFNSKYLADALIAISGESVRLQMSGPGRPTLIKDTSDDSYFYIAMPMNR